MKIDWLVAIVTAVESPDRAEHTILGVILAWRFFGQSGHICGRGAILRCRNPLLSSSNFSKGHLMKMQWLVTDVTAVGSPDRAEHALLWVILVGRFFDQFRPIL